MVKVVERAVGHELVLAGDTFNLSEDPVSGDPAASVLALLGEYSEFRSKLREHLLSGYPLTFLAGNHDAALTDPRSRQWLLAALDVTDEAALTVVPWFIRRGTVHIEHGHLLDPDNAPFHPLAPWSSDSEPLGVAVTRRFLVPCQALEFAHAHETTPMGGLARCFRLYGRRAPRVVWKYFEFAFLQCYFIGKQARRDRYLGEARIHEQAAALALDPVEMRELLAFAPQPTHGRRFSTFRRLYLDRVVGGLLLSVGLVAGGLGAGLLGFLPAGVAASYLGFSIGRKPSRYAGLMEYRLAEGARRIAQRARLNLVVFGHTHRKDEHERYVNSGTFGYPDPEGRAYLRIHPDGSWSRERIKT